MTSLRSVGLVTSWPWRHRVIRTSRLPRERAARRIESYVYGNVLVLAAIVAAGIGEVGGGRAAALALGTAASTYLAHLLAMVVGHQAGEDSEDDHVLRDAVRDGLPMASSGIFPALALGAGWLGWIPTDVAWWIAVVIIGLRLASLGSVVAYLRGDPSSWRTVLIGFGVAIAGVVVALVKNLLTH